MTQTASPWQPPPGSPAHHLHATEPLYRKLMAVLHILAREDANLSTMTVAMVLIDMGADLMIASDLIHASPDLIASLRAVVDKLEQRRESEPAGDLIPTMKEFFAASRPAAAN
jgi:hypothetical protein